MPGEKSAADSAPTKLQTFFKRLFSTVLLWVVVVAGLLLGNQVVRDLAVLLVIGVITVVGVMEICDMISKRGGRVYRAFAIIGGLAFVVGNWWAEVAARKSFFPESAVYLMPLALAGLLAYALLLWRMFSKDMEHGTEKIAYTGLALVYVPLLLGVVMQIYFRHGSNGAWWLLYFILVTKSSDMGAYAVGSMIGKHKMIPRVSPGKTWEGFGGAIVGSALVSLVFAHFAQERLVGMTFLHALVLGIVLGAGSVVGDLVESLFKRESGVKDSGAYFPGIGGVLDLVDSVLFNAPIMMAYIVWRMF